MSAATGTDGAPVVLVEKGREGSLGQWSMNAGFLSSREALLSGWCKV